MNERYGLRDKGLRRHLVAVKCLNFASAGTTPSTFIAEARLQTAPEWLRLYPARSVTDIALSVGFNDSAYFSRCFRNRFGTSPREWRGM